MRGVRAVYLAYLALILIGVVYFSAIGLLGR